MRGECVESAGEDGESKEKGGGDGMSDGWTETEHEKRSTCDISYLLYLYWTRIRRANPPLCQLRGHHSPTVRKEGMTHQVARLLIRHTLFPDPDNREPLGQLDSSLFPPIETATSALAALAAVAVCALPVFDLNMTLDQDVDELGPHGALAPL